MTEHAMIVMVILVFIALIFYFMKSFDELTNSISPMVSTRLLTP